MGAIFAILGFLVFLVLILMAVIFWMVAVVAIGSFFVGGVVSVMLFGGGRDAFYIGGFLSAVIALVVLGVTSSRAADREQ
ncbi:MAG: hypothetical protein COZ86_00140 [Candidatus Moranbacteria bacterium CG_4_8_14_3_um_filter_41_13]|nr:MAG: hypothetical protein COZ86_00140 [Candidatus Moranbacteria bacterium CG_4_8_14_3_um_filter_41_13]